MSELYTSSRLRSLRACPRLHHYQYGLGIRGPETDVMRFGTVGHAALEAYFDAWMHGDLGGRHERAVIAIQASGLPPFEAARLYPLIAAYDLKWGSAPWEVLAVEMEFRYQLGPNAIGGKIDAIVRDLTDERIYVLEHKTTGADVSPGSPYWQKLAIDTQVSIYIDGAAALGHDVAGCIYDVLVRPRHEPKLATPVELRKYTQGKGCKLCGGTLQGKQGTGLSTATSDGKCAVCQGSGWRLDGNNKPETPRLYTNQREHDEDVSDFERRVADEIAEKPDAFLIRGEVVRLEDELPRMRADLQETIRLGRHLDNYESAPRNPDSCARFGQLCHFFPVCSGAASIDDELRFPRSGAHPELAASQPT